jgi:hypothetical protein
MKRSGENGERKSSIFGSITGKIGSCGRPSPCDNLVKAAETRSLIFLMLKLGGGTSCLIGIGGKLGLLAARSLTNGIMNVIFCVGLRVGAVLWLSGAPLGLLYGCLRNPEIYTIILGI